MSKKDSIRIDYLKEQKADYKHKINYNFYGLTTILIITISIMFAMLPILKGMITKLVYGLLNLVIVEIVGLIFLARMKRLENSFRQDSNELNKIYTKILK